MARVWVFLQGDTEQCSIVTNPLEELQPVIVEDQGTYVLWDGDRVLWSSREVPYVVTASEVGFGAKKEPQSIKELTHEHANRVHCHTA